MRRLIVHVEGQTEETFAVLESGLDPIRAQCPNFQNWLSALEAVVS
jgi:hypothetical protein